MLRTITLVSCLLAGCLSSQAAVIVLNWGEQNGNGTFPATFDGGTENFLIPAGESIVSALFESQFGNSLVTSTAVMDVYVNSVLVGSCPDETSFCWTTGPVPFSYAYGAGELASLAGGSATLTIEQLECCVARLGSSTLTITTAPSEVPEPGTFGLLAGGVAGAYWRLKRRSKSA